MACFSVFGHNNGEEYDSATDASPLWDFRFHDSAANQRVWLWHCLILPRVNQAGDSEIYREGDSTDTTGVIEEGTDVSTSVTYPTDLFLRTIRHERGNRNDSEVNWGIDVYNGATLVGLIVQAEPIDHIDTDTYTDWNPDGQPNKADPVIANLPEEIRSNLQALREDYLQVITTWSAHRPGVSNPAVTDATGIIVPGANGALINADTSIDAINILELPVAPSNALSRTANTPGISVHPRYFGRGPTTETDNLKVKLQVRVQAEKEHADDTMEVVFVGPDKFSGNRTTITVDQTSADWDGTSSNYIYLNAEASDTLATTERNKYDVWAYYDDGGNNRDGWIYNIATWIEYE
jgi:hypothetical protein